jgi:hypothetical protein
MNANILYSIVFSINIYTFAVILVNFAAYDK